jgi:dienelactone hydrolase
MDESDKTADEKGRDVAAESAGDHESGNYEKVVQYLTQDGILTSGEIDNMVNSKGRAAVVDYANEHGWHDGRASEEIQVDSDVVASIDLDTLTAAPTVAEIEAVWESIPRDYKADRFEFSGDEISIGKDVAAQGFSYYSEGLKIFGYLYKSKDKGPFPLVIFNHGGFGIGPMVPPPDSVKKSARPFSNWCCDLASEGYVVMASSYRGTKTDVGMSEGRQEGARGEVTDVLNMLMCAKTLPCVDNAKIGMIGTSHGGWITALAAQRTKEIAAAISFFPPANIFFSEDGPHGGAGPRLQSMIDGKMPGKGAVGIIDRAVLLPLLNGSATMVETRAEMIARTIHLFAEHTNSPMYVICGDKDGLYPDSEVLFEALKKHGKETWFRNYPGERHGFTYRGSPEAIDGSFNLTVEFLGKYLK